MSVAERSFIPILPNPRPGLFVVSTIARLLQGMAIGTVAMMSAQMPAFSWQMGMLLFSAVVCGMAVGSALDRITQTLVSQRIAASATLLILFMGVVGANSATHPAIQLVCTFVVGMGAGTEWSALAHIARNAVAARRRWQGMKFWSTAFPAGILLAAAINSHTLVTAIMAIGLVGVTLVLVNLSAGAQPDPGSFSSGDPDSLRAVESAAPITPQNLTESSPAVDEECSETECCGGNSREFAPTGFLHGVILSSIGLVTIFWPLAIIASPIESVPFASLTAFSAGLVAGVWLMYSAAPVTGYAVGMLPFFALAVPSAVAIAFLPADAGWYLLACGVNGIAAGAIAAGSMAVVGELFSDCGDNPVRTRIVSFSLFTTCLLFLLAGFAGAFSAMPRRLVVFEVAVVVAGVLAVRSIPSPILSSRGREDDSPETRDELNDVLAAMNQ